MPRRGVLAITAAALLLGATTAPAQIPGNRPLAPRFVVEGLDGATLELETLRRRGPVLIDFWATWCKPCLAAIPEIQAIHEALEARGVTVLGVSVDGPRNFAKVRPFVKRLGIEYPVAIDQDGALQQKFQVRAMPTTVLVDTSGAIVHVAQGFRPGEGALLRARIEALLGAAAPDSVVDGER
jgi:cytochrome c biogenesis protein CcmG, thiol:disulfide interchange protein DsbE